MKEVKEIVNDIDELLDGNEFYEASIKMFKDFALKIEDLFVENTIGD